MSGGPACVRCSTRSTSRRRTTRWPDSTSTTSCSSASIACQCGERQRVGLARALLSPATLWLIDEPLSALDPARAQQAIDTLCGVARERGHTLVTTLHDVSMALANFARIVGLRDGTMAFDLPARQVSPALLSQLYAQHEHELHADAAQGGDADAALSTRPAAVYCR
jgi:phosphonate transport system ATP-binding protein